MTSYELIGLLIGFGILLASATLLVAVLNALDEGTHGCSREGVEPCSEWEHGECETCHKMREIHIGYGQCGPCIYDAED